jgi:hypothetical protein
MLIPTLAQQGTGSVSSNATGMGFQRTPLLSAMRRRMLGRLRKRTKSGLPLGLSITHLDALTFTISLQLNRLRANACQTEEKENRTFFHSMQELVRSSHWALCYSTAFSRINNRIVSSPMLHRFGYPLLIWDLLLRRYVSHELPNNLLSVPHPLFATCVNVHLHSGKPLNYVMRSG